MKYWLMKSEPDVYSFDDLLNAPDKRTIWEGIRNYQARNFMRDEMQLGDKILFYHSNTKVPGIVGIATIVREAYPDPYQFDQTSPYFDVKSSPDNPRWITVDIQAEHALPKFISLAEMRQLPELAQMRLLQRGNRLSVTPVSAEEYAFILTYASR